MSKIPIFENWEFNNYNFLPTKTAEVEIVESNGKKLKEGILGVVKGPSFFGDSYSRNERFYPKELWENALKNPEFQRNLKRGLVFGCIGHPENYSLDELLSSGAVAVRVTDIDYDGKIGNVTYEVLDTPAGRILNTILRSGSKPYVSTRAFGSFLNEKKEKNGRKVPILNPNDFYLESIDFVLNPGFLETNPELTESIKEDVKGLQKSGIKCEGGVCGLNFQEEKEEEISKKEVINVSKLEKFDKLQLIKMIEDLKLENEYLLKEGEIKEETNSIQLNIVKNSDSEKIDDFKFFKPFIAFLELILKLIRYNTKYESDYEKIVKNIDTSNINIENLAPIEDLCKKIVNDEFDESIKEIANYILIIIDANKGKKDGKEAEKAKEKADEAIAEYIYRYWDVMQDVNNLKGNFEEIINQNQIFKLTSEKMTDKYLEEKENFNLFLEKFNALKQEKNEEISKFKKQENKFFEQIELLKQEKSLFEKELNILKENNKDFKKNFYALKSENKSLTEKLNNSNSEKEELLKIKKKSLTENFENKINEIKKIEEKKFLNIKEELKTYKIKYLQEKYKIESGFIKNLFEKFDNEKIIEKEIKLYKKTSQSSKISENSFDFRIEKNKKPNAKFEKLNNLIR